MKKEEFLSAARDIGVTLTEDQKERLDLLFYEELDELDVSEGILPQN